MVAYSMRISPEWTVGSAICNGNQTNDTKQQKQRAGKKLNVIKRCMCVYAGKQTVYALISFWGQQKVCENTAHSYFSSQRGTFAGCAVLHTVKSNLCLGGSYLSPNYVIRDKSSCCGELGVLQQIALQ